MAASHKRLLRQKAGTHCNGKLIPIRMHWESPIRIRVSIRSPLGSSVRSSKAADPTCKHTAASSARRLHANPQRGARDRGAYVLCGLQVVAGSAAHSRPLASLCNLELKRQRPACEKQRLCRAVCDLYAGPLYNVMFLYHAFSGAL